MKLAVFADVAGFAKFMLLGSFLLGSFAQAGVYTPIDSTYKLTFDEEFNGTSINTAKWGTNWLGATGSITKPINTEENGAYDPAQVSVADGHLVLTSVAKPVTVNGKSYPYRSGIVQTGQGRFSQAYGYFEARIFLPAGAPGKIANWPAFWTAGMGTWPETGEMDVMEGLHGSAAYHFHSPLTGAGATVPGDFTGWHVYGALWTPGLVRYFYDGVEVGRTTYGVTSDPMFIILNLGMSSSLGGPLQAPSKMLVDYVHVYSNSPDAVAVTPEPGYGGPGDTGDSGVPTDTVAPSVPQGLYGAGVSTSQINLNWTASTDNIGVAGYNVYRSGVKLGSTSGTSYSNGGLSAGTSYSYQVSAFDAAGNESARSAVINVTTQSEPPPASANLLANPGFEAKSLVWNLTGSARVVTGKSRSGKKAAHLAATGSAFEQTVTKLTPNTTYRLSAYVRVGASGDDVGVGVKNFGGAQVAFSTTDTSYQLLTMTFTTGPTDTSAVIFFYANSGTGYGDDFSLSK